MSDMHFETEAKNKNISKIIDYVHGIGNKYKIKDEYIVQVSLEIEEICSSLFAHAPKDAICKVDILWHYFASTKIRFTVEGESFNISEEIISKFEDIDFVGAGVGEESQKHITNIIFKAFRDNVKYKRTDNNNVVILSAPKPPKTQMYQTLGALGLAIIFGLLCNLFIPQFLLDAMTGYVLNPISKIFMSALKFVVVPVVFFSIVACVSSFSNMSDLGKIGFKVVRLYFITSVIAIIVGLIVGSFQTGDPALSSAVTNSGSEHINTASNTSISILGTIMAIVPDNIVKPFLNAEMIAIIFVALIVGIALNNIKHSSDALVRFFTQANDLFLNITTMIVRFIPIAIFTSITLIIVSFSPESIMSLLILLLQIVLGCLLMLVVYILIAMIFGRINPIYFLKKALPAFVTAFSISSSSAAMPVTLKCCQRMGISRNVYSFSIPLGATINMDGNCVQFAVVALFMCQVFDIDITSSLIFSLVVTSLIISFACPGIPGAALVCLVLIFSQIGVPAEAISLILGINVIIDMFVTAGNVMGDVAASLIVSKRVNMLDLDVYRS